MSAYATLTTQFKDRACLVIALAKQGYTEVEIHEEAQPLVGYHGDLRGERANVIVRRQHIGGSSNDIGFVKTPEGKYAAIISDFDSRKHNAQWMNELKAHYTEAVTTKEAKRQGLRLVSRKVENGKTVVKYLQL